jgi:transporter family protein
MVAIFTVIFLGERLSGYNWLGILLVATGAILIAYR